MVMKSTMWTSPPRGTPRNCSRRGQLTLPNLAIKIAAHRAGRDRAVGKKSSGWGILNFEAIKTPPEWLAAAVYAIATLLLAYVGYMIMLGLVAFTNLGHQIVSGVTSASPKSEGSGSLTVFFTVLLALVGGPLLIWRVITSHVQAQAARHQAQTAREGHYTDLFTKAVEQLGATREVKRTIEVADGESTKRELVTETEPNLEVRLGAIYALERIAHDSERDHWPIMEVLCAYIKNPQNSGEPRLTSDFKAALNWVEGIPKLRGDVQAALTVIGRRAPERIAYEAARNLKIDLSFANLQRADLSGGQFANALFVGAYLELAVFHRSNLDAAIFASANLTNSSWSAATVYRTRFGGSTGLSTKSLALAFGDGSTTLPKTMQTPWPEPRSS